MHSLGTQGMLTPTYSNTVDEKIKEKVELFSLKINLMSLGAKNIIIPQS